VRLGDNPGDWEESAGRLDAAALSLSRAAPLGAAAHIICDIIYIIYRRDEDKERMSLHVYDIMPETEKMWAGIYFYLMHW
jgi:hypothetical protein